MLQNVSKCLFEWPNLFFFTIRSASFSQPRPQLSESFYSLNTARTQMSLYLDWIVK